MKFNDFAGIILRYLILVLLGAFNLAIFYFVFTPLTVYPVYWILSLFGEGVKLVGKNFIYLGVIKIEIIRACVGGAAYYFLLSLNLTTPMKIQKRIKSILFLFGSFLVVNIIRILIFVTLFFYGYEYFDVSHLLVWYLGSTILVVLIWFTNVYIFKIKEVPVYYDFKRIYNEIKRKKNEY